MFSVLITSTMKSEPLRASVSGVASGSTFSFGGTGRTLAARGAGVCALALFAAAARPSAGPAATAPARNWRRFILGDLDKEASLVFGRICHSGTIKPSNGSQVEIDRFYGPVVVVVVVVGGKGGRWARTS